MEHSIQPKSSLKLRSDFLSRLAYDRLWPTERPKTHQTVVLLDWDDTLFCTEFISEHNSNLNDITKIEYPDKYKSQMTHLDETAAELLRQAKQLGVVCIVTNALNGWV